MPSGRPAAGFRDGQLDAGCGGSSDDGSGGGVVPGPEDGDELPSGGYGKVGEETPYPAGDGGE